jgi:hypothetical protein
MYKYHLVGPHEGKTIMLGGHQFQDGVFEFGANAEGVQPSKEEARRKGIALAKSYQAFLEGPALDAARAAFKAGDAPAGGELDVNEREDKEQAERGEQAAKTTERKGAVRSALAKLDPENDDHWTNGGLPSVEAVRELSGNKDVSRQDINALATNLNREEAAKLAADPLD